LAKTTPGEDRADGERRERDQHDERALVRLVGMAVAMGVIVIALGTVGVGMRIGMAMGAATPCAAAWAWSS
jgi:hypothetical protein